MNYIHSRYQVSLSACSPLSLPVVHVSRPGLLHGIGYGLLTRCVQKAGHISNEDLLYTLSVFITEPISWVEKYEWRSMNDLEICAIATFWKSIGDAMGIQYTGYLARIGWPDGLEFYKDIKAWATNYEVKFMVPAKTNKITADELIPLLLFYVPYRLRAAGSHMVGVMMGDRLRAAMMLVGFCFPYLGN